MRVPSASQLLEVWERGLAQPSVQRALLLLAVACPEKSLDDLARLSIGQRDALLLTLREWTFGSQLDGVTSCPQCSEGLELTFNVADVRATSQVEPDESLTLNAAGYQVQFRLPNSLDLTVADSQAVTSAQRALVERCVLSAHQNGEERSADQLPEQVVMAMQERMSQADPQALVQLNVTCPACGHPWQAEFDIGSYFWAEVNAFALRSLQQVHTLALAYGWSEADILAMSPWRRQIYLEMLGA